MVISPKTSNKHNFRNGLNKEKCNFLTTQNILNNKLKYDCNINNLIMHNASKFRLRGGGVLQNQMFPNMPGGMPMCFQTNSPVIYMPSMPDFQQQNAPVVVCSPLLNSCGAPTLIITLPTASTAPPPVATPKRVPQMQVARPAPKRRLQTAPDPNVRQKLVFDSPSPTKKVELPKVSPSAKKPSRFSHLKGKLYIQDGQIVPWPEGVVEGTPISPRDYTPLPGESWLRYTDEVQTPKSPVRIKQGCTPRGGQPKQNLMVQPARANDYKEEQRHFLGVPEDSGKFVSLGCSSLSDPNVSPQEIAQRILAMTEMRKQNDEDLATKDAREKALMLKLIEALHYRRQREIMQMVKDALEGRLPLGMKDNTARF
ncbi:uncharacterized protein LOC123015520 [Tribolium madens]|uniref:uncharacterized protein LOC123015520 n=1 Tax=Tribolium madens TaxID=41895 RepID=UPI001CF74489|nr:uncharacterized protein LOC123015520 [Tribolium madens]